MSKPLATTGVESLDNIILKCPKCPKRPRILCQFDIKNLNNKKKEDQINDLL